MYNPELTSFLTTDNIKLPALLFKPTKNTKKIALFLHGNGSSGSFYSTKRINAIAQELNAIGVSFFSFNNRGAHYIMSLKRTIDETTEERVHLGMSYELIKDCIKDIDGAINFLKEKGYEEFYLIGMSTGANKAVIYNYYKKNNDISKFILLCGGDDTGIYYSSLGHKKFMYILEKSREMIQAAKGEQIAAKKYSPYFPMSYQALYDTLNPDGDYNIFPFYEYLNKLTLSTKKLFREYKKIDTPTLVVYGAYDEYCYGDVHACIEILKKETTNVKTTTFALIPEADHGFTGKDEELAKIIAGWMEIS